MILKSEVIKLQTESQAKLPDSLEKMVCTQEDASLQSPGVVAHYYRFLYALAKRMKPTVTVELGTHTGISVACLAEGCPLGTVYTVDNKNQLNESFRRPGIKYLIQDSLVDLPVDKIDILFIDTLHNGQKALEEYHGFKNKVADDGIILFDDVYLNTEMTKFWNSFVPEKGIKFDLDVHGNAGFGVVLMTA